MEHSSSVLRVENLSVGYDGKVILRNLNFSVGTGEIVVLLGSSGCGKSTLLRHLIGLLPPLSGRILFGDRVFADAQNPGSEEERDNVLRRIGVMFQSGALFGAMTLLENVLLPIREFTDLPHDLAVICAEMKLDSVGLLEYAHYFPSEISGGMQKRAAIARAIALDPKILFLDEPSAGLDPVTSDALDRLILSIRGKYGTSVVMVSHELASIFSIADRAVFLDKKTGGILDEGSPESLRDRSVHPEVAAFFNRGNSQKGR